LNQSPVRTIGLNINSTIKGSEEGLWEIKPYIQAELARLVTGIEDTSLDDAYNEDYIQFGIDSSVGDWQYGIRTRVNPTIQVDEDFVEVFELGIGVPFRQGDLLLRPYIGVNFVSLFTDAYEFDVSTYGFSAYYECCGNTSSFFEVRDGNLTTGLVLPF